MQTDELYWGIGNLLGGLASLATFVGSWWYCAATYGFLFGFGLGWLPSIILAIIVFFAVKVLWAPAALIIVVLGYQIYSNGSKSGEELPFQTAESADPSKTDVIPETPNTVALDATLQFSSPSECIAMGTLEKIYKKLDSAMDGDKAGLTVKLDAFASPLPVTATSRTDKDRIVFSESYVRFPKYTMWNGLWISRLKAEAIIPPESDSVYSRSITFLDPPEKVRSALNQLGFNAKIRPEYTALPDTYNSCGGSMQIEAMPGGSSLSCGWGC